MRRILLNNASHYLRPSITFKPISSIRSNFKSFSSSDTSSPETNLAESLKKDPSIDVSNKDFKALINKHFQENDEEVIPDIMTAILKRRLSGKHEETDDELMDELVMRPLDNIPEEEIESDFEELYSTDEDIEDLYNARQYVEKKMAKDEYFNMDDKKWDEMIKEATEKGFLKDTKECEEILEDMLSWDKLLPDEIKEKVEAKFNELGVMCERGEISAEEGYEMFKDFEDKMVIECQEIMAAEQPPVDDDTRTPDKNMPVYDPDPPGEGPILRWQSRCVFAPGGDAWHPKNRKVKLSVTVKEIGLSKPAFRRLRELVGKRYHSGKDELTITSERFEHREENRKDCLRTLLSLIEEAAKATKLVEETRTSYIKEGLKGNAAFMERLLAKTMKIKASRSAVPA